MITAKPIQLEKVYVFDWPNRGTLVNTFPADENYTVLNRDNLTIPIQMQLSQKQKKFSDFFAPFLNSNLNFERFEKKGDPHTFCISEVTDSENVVR